MSNTEVKDTALSTVDHFKTRHGVTGSNDDELIARLINTVSDWIESQTERKLKARRYNNGGATHSTTKVADEDYIYFDGTTRDLGGETDIDPRGYGMFYLPQSPVEANSVLTFALATLDDRDSSGGETWDTADLVEFDDFIVDREKGIIRLLNGPFAFGYRNYRVTMSAGYQKGDNQPYVPEDLEELCLSLAEKLYEDKTNLQSEQIGTWSRTFNTQKEDPFVVETLAKYRRYSL